MDLAAERHRTFAATFTDRVVNTRDWDVQAPVAGWTARSVVEHLVTWLPGLLASGSDERLVAGPDPTEDPVGAWHHQRDAVQAILDEPARSGAAFRSPLMDATTVGGMIDQFYTPDVFMHTWDLARATGQDDRLDAEVSESFVAGMEPMEGMLRASGQFGAARGPLPDDADATDRLISFIGRDPRWVSGH